MPVYHTAGKTDRQTDRQPEQWTVRRLDSSIIDAKALTGRRKRRRKRANRRRTKNPIRVYRFPTDK